MAEYKFLAHLNLNGNEIQNAKFQQLASAPEGAEGRFYEDTTLHAFGAFINGEWVYFATKAELIAGLAEKQDNLTFESGSPLSLDSSDSSLLKIALSTDIAATGSAVDTKVATEKAVRDLYNEIPADTMTFTNKSFDAEGTGNSLTNVKATNFKATALDLADQEAAADATLPSSARVDEKIAAAQLNALKYRGTWAITADTTSDMSDLASYLPIAKGDFFSVSGTGPVTISGVEYNPGDMIIANAKITASSGLVPTAFDKVDNTESTDLVRLNTTQTLTNKTIDADDNTIVDLTMANFNSSKIALGTSEAAADGVVPSQAKVEELISAAAPGVDDVTIESYPNSAGSGPEYNIRVKDGGLTVEKFNASDLSLGASETQANAVLVSQQKVTEDIEDFRTAAKTLTNKTLDLATSGEGAGNNVITNAQLGIFADGVVVNSTTGIGPASGEGAASNDKIATEAAVRALVDSTSGAGVHVYSEDNGEITPVGGQATWTITHGLNRGKLVQVEVFEKATGESVGVNVTRTATTVVLTWNASANVAAETYTAVIIG